MSQIRSRILGIRNYFPTEVRTNAFFTNYLDTTDEWIVERTGIKERRVSAAHETPSFMGTEAARVLLRDLKISPDEIDVIVCATITPDYPFPASAGMVQAALGCKNAWAFDISAACSGYLYALDVARAFVESGMHQRVLLIAAEKMTSLMNFEDRSTCILFGDAGSASLIVRGTDESYILGSKMRTDGTGVPFLIKPTGGSLHPLTIETIQEKKHYAMQDGRAVYKRAVVDMAQVGLDLLDELKIAKEKIKLFVPHQANLRIIESCAERFGLSMDRVAVNIQKYGNTTSATIPTALQGAIEEGKVHQGDLVLMAAFGAGFTWGATLLKL